jgi:ferredoxin
MRVHVDLDLCRGHGLCVDAAPTVFRLNDDGLCDVLIEFPPDELRSQVEDAVERCPVDAIAIEP